MRNSKVSFFPAKTFKVFYETNKGFMQKVPRVYQEEKPFQVL